MMAGSPPDSQRLLRPEGSDVSDGSTAIGSPHQHQGYRRVYTQGSIDLPNNLPQPTFATSNMNDNVLGLGISRSINRVPVGSRSSPTPLSPSKPFTPSMSAANSPLSPQIPGSSRSLLSPLASPTWQRHDSGNFTLGGGLDLLDDMHAHNASQSKSSANESVDNVDTEDHPDDDDSGHLQGCPTTRDVHSLRASWLSISLLILSIYSTIFSGIWLMLAIVQPRYGRTIYSGGALSPSTASTLFAMGAKTIELSFVTVFVTFLGQVLSRRSFVKVSRGVTIAELTMRTWVIQPGFMFTHWGYIRNAGLSVLGGITLTAAFVAMFYTTASDALVSPHLKYGKWEHKLMEGLVQASYANPSYIQNNCQTPVTLVMDGNYAGSTCLSVEHAGQAYHNLLTYLDTWATVSRGGEGASTKISERPLPVGMLYDNTTVAGSWVETNYSDLATAYKTYNRIVNNVTMSMPHVGVFSAAHDPKNGILQPEDLAGLGEYSVRASVVGPTVNVLCSNMNATELEPLIYVDWPHAKTSTILKQKIAYSGYQNEVQLEPGHLYLNSTVVDDIFEWGPTYQRQPPIFPMLPIEFNSIINITVPNSDSIYILLKSSTIEDYTMCQLRSFLSPFCSTRYNVAGINEGRLVSNCEDPSDSDAYDKSVPNPPIIRSTDWRNVASLWALSLSLNDGIANSNASDARLLSQFIPQVPPWGDVQLNPLLPSISEALAVFAGSTLLLSTMGASYYHFWNYTGMMLDPGIYLPFNASLSSQQYTSGYSQQWQGIFYVVLSLVFATNVFCLVYFFLRSGLVTDYTESQNLFALAINSPSSKSLKGSCGAGPESDHLNVPWHVSREESSNHFFIREAGGSGSDESELKRRKHRHNLKSVSSYSMLSNKRKSWL